MSYAVYHIRNGTCKYPIFLHQNIEDKIIHASMSRKDNSTDNGMMESFFSILKSEMFYGYEKKFKSVKT